MKGGGLAIFSGRLLISLASFSLRCDAVEHLQSRERTLDTRDLRVAERTRERRHTSTRIYRAATT
jgi:hypothetical protein